MFRRILLVMVIFYLPQSVPAKAEQSSSLSGEWIGYGYECYDSRGILVEIPWETAEISYADGRIVATKIVGDDCVTSGNVTWYGDVGPEIEPNKVYSARVAVGLPQSPNSGLEPATLKLDNDGVIFVFGPGWELSFVRNRKISH